MAKKDNKNENKSDKHFFKSFKAELKKVIWPTPKQLVNNTVAVVTIVLITAAIVFALDVVFDMGNKYGISSLQNIVNEKYHNADNNTENTDNADNNEENTNSDEEDNTTTEEMTTEQDTENTSSTDEATTDVNQANQE